MAKKKRRLEGRYIGVIYKVLASVPGEPVLLLCPFCHSTFMTQIKLHEAPGFCCCSSCGGGNARYYHFCGACDRPVAAVQDPAFAPQDSLLDNLEIKDIYADSDGWEDTEDEAAKVNAK